MTKRHFEKIAQTINDSRQNFPKSSTALLDLAGRLAFLFRAHNPHFNAGRFLKACGF